MSQYSHLSDVDDQMAAAIKKLPPNRSVVDVVKARKDIEASIATYEKIRERFLPPGETYRLQDFTIPVDCGTISARALIPASDGVPGHTFPLFVWIHGGGYCIGDLHMDDYYLREICVDLQVSILSLEYRLAPEYPFPTGLDDCYTGLKWAVENYALLKASVHRGLIIGGASAGANMSAVIAHRARDDPFFTGQPVTGQFLQIPFVIHPDAYPEEHKSKLISIQQNKDAPILPVENILTFCKHLGVPPSHPELSVLLNPNHKGLAPAYIQVAGFDPLRDDGFLYEEVLKEAGVRTKLDSYAGLPHGVHGYFPDVGICQKFDRDFREGLRWLLERDAVTTA